MQTYSSASQEISESHDSQTPGRIVANVAQELKSPLAAMAEGHKHIASILKDVRNRLSGIPEVPEKLLQDLEDVECTLDSTSNLSHFMKMSINRCIEYSHVREHHSLSPNLVSVKLADALRLPVACVTSIDPTHQLEVKPFPFDLCSHIMVDLQWLQENILLLLANAVKYSNNPGHTTLSLSLRTSSSLKDEFSITPVPKEKISHTLHSNVMFSGDDCVLLHVEVEDTGVGLTPERVTQLFSPQEIQQRIATGTGLGLLSLYKRMEALNGHCGVRNRRDGRQGCLFWFAFPYIPDQLTAEMLHMDRPLHANTKNVNATTQNTNANVPVGIAEQVATPTDTDNAPEHDVLNSTLKNVLPSPMLFEPSGSHDNFNAFAPIPMYTKKSNSRSLRSAMNNLPTTIQKGGHITIANNETRINGSRDPTGSAEKVNSSSLNSNNINNNSTNNNNSSSKEGSIPSDAQTPVPRWESTSNRLSTSSSQSTDAAFSRSNSGAKRSSGRSFMLNLPNEVSPRPTSTNTATTTNINIGSDVTTNDKMRSSTLTDTDLALVSIVETDYINTNTTSTNETDHATTTTDSGTLNNNNNNSYYNNNNTITTTTTTTTTITTNQPILTHANLHNITPPQLHTMEPSPASSTGTPHHITTDNGWKPDLLSMIRTYIYNILLVEDTPMVLKMTSFILAREGFNVTTAENGAQALDLMLHRRFDVVLMDLQMPVLNGLQAASRVRQREHDNNEEPTFLIAVSANNDKSIVIQTLGAGFDNYIEKPFTIDQFQSVSSKYLMKKHPK